VEIDEALAAADGAALATACLPQLARDRTTAPAVAVTDGVIVNNLILYCCACTCVCCLLVFFFFSLFCDRESM
jgi:hypothetical protein